MPSQIGSPKVASPVGLRRVPRDFHSVAKQASFYSRFGDNFGSQNELEKRPKIDVWLSFFESFFGMDFISFFI